MTTALFLALSPICALVYAAICSVFMWIDLRVPSWSKHRIQAKRPTIADYKSMTPILLQNTVVAVLVMPCFVVVIYPKLGVTDDWPSLGRLLYDIVVFSLVYDTWFYLTHRLFHLPFLYR